MERRTRISCKHGVVRCVGFNQAGEDFSAACREVTRRIRVFRASIAKSAHKPSGREVRSEVHEPTLDLGIGRHLVVGGSTGLDHLG